jgi:carbonic anhydrase
MESGAMSARITLDQLKEGVREFQQVTFEENKDLFEELANGQKPHTLMITCSDSRIRPNEITGSKAGDLFMMRNIANVVPQYNGNPASKIVAVFKSAMTKLIKFAVQALQLGITVTEEAGAVIEYAVKALGVEHIVIMGHSDCGGMKGLLHPEMLSSLPAVSAWLTQAAEAHEHCYASADATAQLAEVTKNNVLLQMKHAASYPSVQEAVANGKLQIHGWVYDIESGKVSSFDQEQCRWRDLVDTDQAELFDGIAFEDGSGHHVHIG